MGMNLDPDCLGPSSHGGIRPEARVQSAALTSDKTVRTLSGLTSSSLTNIAPVGKIPQPNTGIGTVPGHP